MVFVLVAFASIRNSTVFTGRRLGEDFSERRREKEQQVSNMEEEVLHDFGYSLEQNSNKY